MSERVQHLAPEATEPRAVGPAGASPRRTAARRGPGISLGDALVQGKLSVGASNDPYEREADAVATRVVRALSRGTNDDQGDSQSRVQRRLDTTEPISRVRRASAARPAADVAAPTQRIQRAVQVGAEGGDLDADTARMLQSSRSGGAPLADVARATMEGAFGADFSSIRVHTDSTATELNDRIQAKAFATGSDIYFRDGGPDVSSQSGQALLAHELTHTIQQGAAPISRVTDILGGLRPLSTDVQRNSIQRVFDAATPSTYDDGGGHAIAEHGPERPEDEHKARAKVNAPTYSSSGWASAEKMKSAVMKAFATRSAPGAKIMKSGTKYYMKWTVNVALAKCGYTWKSDAGKDPITKTDVDTAVVIFSINEGTGAIEKMTTAFPGAPAKEFNASV